MPERGEARKCQLTQPARVNGAELVQFRLVLLDALAPLGQLPLSGRVRGRPLGEEGGEWGVSCSKAEIDKIKVTEYRMSNGANIVHSRDNN